MSSTRDTVRRGPVTEKDRGRRSSAGEGAAAAAAVVREPRQRTSLIVPSALRTYFTAGPRTAPDPVAAPWLRWWLA